MPHPDLSIIIVSWNVRELLRACLASIRQSPGVRFADGDRAGGGEPAGASSEAPASLSLEVLVVDNASADGSAAMVAADFPWVQLIANPDNRGFTRGNNQALALARGRYVLFLNPDTELVGDALLQMVAYLEAHPAAGVAGPRLRYADGTPQSSCRRFPTLLGALFESTPLAWHWPRNPWAQRYHMADLPDGGPGARPQVVDWLVGAALLTRRAVLEQVGGFDEGYFMYSEELDWCRRAGAAGWQAVYLPGATIVHHEGKSSEQVVAARHIRFQSSKLRYFRKHHGRLPAGVLRVSILAMYGGEYLLEGTKWLLGSRRVLRRERLEAYGRLLRSGLQEGST